MKKAHLTSLLIVFAFLAACTGETQKEGGEETTSEEQVTVAPCDIPREGRKIIALKFDDQIDLINANSLKIQLQKYYGANSIEDLAVSVVKEHYFLTGKGNLNDGGMISFGIQVKGICEEQLFFTRAAAYEQTAKSNAGCDHCDLVLHDEHEGAHSGEGDTDCCKHEVSEFKEGQEGGFSHLLFESETI